MSRQSPNILSAALLLMVWIATPILSLVHSVVEQHSYCTEHERVEDAGQAHGAPMLASQSNKDGETPAEAEQGESPGHSEGHEECAFGDSFTRETLVYETSTTFVTALYALEDAAKFPPASHTPATALLRIAPKNSPPFAV